MHAEPQLAVRLLAAANAIAAAIGAALPPFDTGVYDQYLATARGELTEDAFAAAWTVGQHMPLDQLVATASAFAGLAEPESVSATSPGSPVTSLSPRQAEVARLVARGLTNAEIGRALFIAEATAKWHVQQIPAALGLRNRTEIGAYVTPQGLV